ncbi:MAG: VOC family protein [Rhodocyclaceae bacterium]|nr:VOC family protein [Rhodocyclaceae bacterium]
MAVIDHLVVAAADLDVGSAWLEAHLGVPLLPGGRHAAMGTHNRLLRLGERLYLELIAVDPQAPAPSRPRWFGLDDPRLREKLTQRPRLIHWVARSDDIAAEAARCPEPPGDVLAMQRGDFRWRITVPDDGHAPGDGLVPTLIQWEVPFHPAERLPDTGCTLMKLEGFAAVPTAIAAALAVLGLSRALALHVAPPGEGSQLAAYLKTPRGLRELD